MFSRNYFIHKDEEADISPEETLVDSISGFSSVEVPISRNTVRFVYFVLSIIFSVFLFQAYRLQIANGQYFQALADQSRFYRYPVPSLRGIIYDRHGTPLAENYPVFDLVAVQAQLDKNADFESLDQVLDWPGGQATSLIAENKDNGVFALKKNISKEQAILIQGLDLPGVYIAAYARRAYEYGSVFSHVVGYTSQISSDELTSNPNLSINERVGRIGLEAYYDKTLRGQSFDILLDPDLIQSQSPIAGGSLVTELDKDMQMQLYQALDSVFRQSGVARGAAIVQDVHTGAIRAMVSFPDFDPNLFEYLPDQKSEDRLAHILVDRNKPLFNRAISGLYSPGSTIKPFLALVALKEKVITTSTLIYANGAIQVQSEVDPSSYYTFRDWKVHGWTDVYKAIADSVDIFYYALGGGYMDVHGLGIDRIEQYLKAALADQKLGIDLPAEVNGFVPSKQWKKETKNDSWYVGDTYNVSIGQGDLLVTPLWLSTYVSAVANGGTLWRPYIVQGQQEKIGSLPFDDQTFAVVKKGMRQTVTDGTGKILSDLPVHLAAKTGTAQVSGQALNSLFVVYGPYEDPEISMTILVENIPQSQSLAMQVAKKFMAWYFTKQDE